MVDEERARKLTVDARTMTLKSIMVKLGQQEVFERALVAVREKLEAGCDIFDCMEAGGDSFFKSLVEQEHG